MHRIVYLVAETGEMYMKDADNSWVQIMVNGLKFIWVTISDNNVVWTITDDHK